MLFKPGRVDWMLGGNKLWRRVLNAYSSTSTLFYVLGLIKLHQQFRVSAYWSLGGFASSKMSLAINPRPTTHKTDVIPKRTLSVAPPFKWTGKPSGCYKRE